jgi:hypothetical protein
MQEGGKGKILERERETKKEREKEREEEKGRIRSEGREEKKSDKPYLASLLSSVGEGLKVDHPSIEDEREAKKQQAQ